MKLLVIVLGILLLVGGLPMAWKFAKGAARLILSILIFVGAVALLWYGIVVLAAAV